MQAKSINNPTRLIEHHQLGISSHVAYTLVVTVNLPDISSISNREQHQSPYNFEAENHLFFPKLVCILLSNLAVMVLLLNLNYQHFLPSHDKAQKNG